MRETKDILRNKLFPQKAKSQTTWLWTHPKRDDRNIFQRSETEINSWQKIRDDTEASPLVNVSTTVDQQYILWSDPRWPRCHRTQTWIGTDQDVSVRVNIILHSGHASHTRMHAHWHVLSLQNISRIPWNNPTLELECDINSYHPPLTLSVIPSGCGKCVSRDNDSFLAIYFFLLQIF